MLINHLKLLLTDNDLPVLLVVGDFVSDAELGKRGPAHDVDNEPRHVLLVGDVHLVLAVPSSVSTAAINEYQ